MADNDANFSDTSCLELSSTANRRKCGLGDRAWCLLAFRMVFVRRSPNIQKEHDVDRVVDVHGPALRLVAECCPPNTQEEHDAVSWLVLEGSVLLFDWCEPLSVLGHGGCVAEFLAWSTLATESMVSLSTVKVLA